MKWQTAVERVCLLPMELLQAAQVEVEAEVVAVAVAVTVAVSELKSNATEMLTIAAIRKLIWHLKLNFFN